ncbi:hypothetical protein E2C01_063826 [Portunus trituberculatus]|uniref:Uncharacterized protein n=1 Tax=Portunus trituberculatus TaxID=210409 RepID=A0A5B7HI44_PORTR|nr:hypothetical protein [Portunus trituberculatus]
MAFTISRNIVLVIVSLAALRECEGRVGGWEGRCRVEAVGSGGKPWHWAGSPSSVTRSYLLTVVKEEDLVLMEGSPPRSVNYPLFDIQCDVSPRRWWATHRDIRTKPRKSRQAMIPATRRLVPLSNICLVRPILHSLLKLLEIKKSQPIQTSDTHIREYSVDYCYWRLPVTRGTSVRQRLMNNTREAARSASELWKKL